MIINYAKGKQIDTDDMAPISGMWIHSCRLERKEVLTGIKLGEICNSCGATERQRLDKQEVEHG